NGRISFVHGSFDHVTVDALDFRVRDHAAAAELFVVTAESGIGGGVARVVEVLLVLEARDDPLDGSLVRAAVAHQPLEFGDRTHAAAERAYGIVVKGTFIEEIGFGATHRHCRHERSCPSACSAAILPDPDSPRPRKCSWGHKAAHRPRPLRPGSS